MIKKAKANPENNLGIQFKQRKAWQKIEGKLEANAKLNAHSIEQLKQEVSSDQESVQERLNELTLQVSHQEDTIEALKEQKNAIQALEEQKVSIEEEFKSEIRKLYIYLLILSGMSVVTVVLFVLR